MKQLEQEKKDLNGKFGSISSSKSNDVTTEKIEIELNTKTRVIRSISGKGLNLKKY